MKYVGIDGCKAGWAAWVVGNSKPQLVIWESLEELVSFLGHDGLWLIDMPIGFSTQDQPDRLCDKGARALLKHRRSSVFTVPCRDAVYADSYEQASELNFAQLGKKFSKQTWGIVPKMRELDGLLASVQPSDLRIRESHPEVVFAALAGRPLSFNKKTIEGREERLAIVKRYMPEWFDCLLLEMSVIPRKVAQLDDLIDAFILMFAATKWNELVTLPPVATSKENGRTREIVYYQTP